MASNTKMMPLKEEVLEKEGPEIRPDSPLLDLSDAAINKLIRSAKKRGYVTHVQINELLSTEEVETEEAEPEDEGAGEEAESERGELGEIQQPTAPAKASTEEPTGRTDDPVRMYLREMSSVELLSREGEIAIAKRIEAGREAMIAGLCESPLTFQAIVIWRDELNDGKVLLRDIIDLDATYAGPDAKAAPAPVTGSAGQLIVGIAVPGQPGRPPQIPAPATAPATATPFKPAGNAPPARRWKPTGRSARATSTMTIWRVGARSPQSRWSSSPR